ncbi:uncharacterized protein LOC124412730, partial [Diprion similis]|uniref:uncharacterized protein LOC124412730 n=1 Tax=Diprion similis TaxID=362088 RepID=UPI001EF9A2E1
ILFVELVKMLVFNVALVLICLTSVVTSLIVVNESSKAKRKSRSALENPLEGSKIATTTPATLSSSAGSAGGSEHENVVRNGISQPIIAVSDPAASKETTIVAEGGSFMTSETHRIPSFGKNTQGKKPAKSSIVPRKGVSEDEKLSGIKVDNREDLSRLNNSEMLSKNLSPSEGFSSTSTSTELPVISKLTTPVIDNSEHPKSKLNHNKSDSTQLKISSENINVSQVSHRAKPTFTIGEGKDDEDMPSTTAQKPQIGVIRKIDYIVPIAITIMAVPLLGVGAFVLYRQGRDCWDKRHYRRMDFLIDGMYND